MKIGRSRFRMLGVFFAFAAFNQAASAQAIQGTKPLEIEGDIAAQLVDGVDAFLLSEIERSVIDREKFWHRDFSSPEAYSNSLNENRSRLSYRLGVRDPRIEFDSLEYVSSTSSSQLVHEGEGYKVYAVRWPVIQNMHGEGLWLVPDTEPLANVIAIPDADQTPEMICGLVPGLPSECQFARQLAANGCCVLVPSLISREYKIRNGRSKMTNREFLYRSAFVLGRHLVGYEVQKVLACVDWFRGDASRASQPIGVIGTGEGGMIALYAGALDTRIDSVCVSGFFGDRQGIWNEPISRNVFGLLEEFGDAELASMILPRTLVVDGNGSPTLELPSEGGAPGTLKPQTNEQVTRELFRLSRLTEPLNVTVEHVPIGEREMAATHPNACEVFWKGLIHEPDRSYVLQNSAIASPQSERNVVRSVERHERQFREIQQHNEWLLDEAASTRRGFFNLGSNPSDKRPGMHTIDTSTIAGYEKSIEPYRDYFRDEVIGRFDLPLVDLNARSRLVYEKPNWTGYEVVLDVFPGVIAYGILCLPNDLQPNEKRPVVVCQHGLEGRPQDIVQGDHPAYHDFASKLAERGYITFAPQNLYIGKDRFRTLQRKANPLKKTLFSVIVPQHQQILNWLKTLPNVDGERIAFYGLSYGGKSAMRIPPLVQDYCLSICSADFNDWVNKNATTRENYSYVWTNEYEIFEYDLGSTFNYAEMAALIAPRPFMVERGHFDGVGTDERVAFEFAKVRFLYAARLGIPERCEIDWFNGPHTINGKRTFEFLDRHLRFSPR